MQMFSFVNFTPTKIEAVIYNSCLNNNILYNNDTKIIYIKDLSTNKYYDIVTNDDFRENTSKSKL